MGALGSSLFMLQVILSEPPLNGDYRTSIAWHLFRPFQGMAAALAIYLVLRAGQVSLTTGGSATAAPTDLNVFVLGLLGVISGLLSDSAMERLKAVGLDVLPTSAARQTQRELSLKGQPTVPGHLEKPPEAKLQDKGSAAGANPPERSTIGSTSAPATALGDAAPGSPKTDLEVTSDKELLDRQSVANTKLPAQSTSFTMAAAAERAEPDGTSGSLSKELKVTATVLGGIGSNLDAAASDRLINAKPVTNANSPEQATTGPASAAVAESETAPGDIKVFSDDRKLNRQIMADADLPEQSTSGAASAVGGRPVRAERGKRVTKPKHHEE
jgi:hypothetical protein